MRTDPFKLKERKKIRRHIKWDVPFTALLWSVVRKKRLQGMIFRCEHRIPWLQDREIIATFYCPRYRFILEPIIGSYTWDMKEKDRFLYRRGFYAHRIRETYDVLEIRNELLDIFGDYENWIRELGICLCARE